MICINCKLYFNDESICFDKCWDKIIFSLVNNKTLNSIIYKIK